MVQARGGRGRSSRSVTARRASSGQPLPTIARDGCMVNRIGPLQMLFAGSRCLRRSGQIEDLPTTARDGCKCWRRPAACMRLRMLDRRLLPAPATLAPPCGCWRRLTRKKRTTSLPTIALRRRPGVCARAPLSQARRRGWAGTVVESSSSTMTSIKRVVDLAVSTDARDLQPRAGSRHRLPHRLPSRGSRPAQNRCPRAPCTDDLHQICSRPLPPPNCTAVCAVDLLSAPAHRSRRRAGGGGRALSWNPAARQ
jgi:hypothetical protein